jgi:hypothetical protein
MWLSSIRTPIVRLPIGSRSRRGARQDGLNARYGSEASESRGRRKLLPSRSSQSSASHAAETLPPPPPLAGGGLGLTLNGDGTVTVTLGWSLAAFGSGSSASIDAATVNGPSDVGIALTESTIGAAPIRRKSYEHVTA